ncbi:MAG: hypothetical protein A2842_02585 [Candidatus Wildermuthbacteria bacterium RIFCSPHIGHO2_01_FULL_48_25]|uniref:Uncharacterized protein n=1 Tax=Candidatus Wildermuthbacteria bacterium RIFCSPLOWO2_01_FULL_48_16 TaxID=1802461 RepID=A0A1G2RJ31_9BACT|nr:MAG: hypothetical protein A2842_02585 [Candidatus Wildermuthbacteria bacterium RIFCSPHIGHO2_01_FULL_48_25]OHA69172.1 MAG: hypothetical protein A3J57_02465 [Candidatus Wildermuthbacteria bacterium RIFCSPHIGHO2_02_FULL_49_12b]OHA72850.1 MAG: hypothetical protein A3B24_00070 [Candidatus Wildermuthbacteria bacterium RIFCSPLOWO2_01_FULL_48_16]
MKIFIKAKPGAREEGIEKIDEAHFVVSVKEPPKEGRANRAIEKALTEYLHKPVKLVSGFVSRQKVFEVGE